MELAADVYRVTQDMPESERFGLTVQVRRAAVGVASCIAEGNARHSRADYRRFLSMASGSLAEVETQIRLAARLGFLGQGMIDPVLARARATARMLQALRNALVREVAPASPRSLFPLSRSRS